MVHTAVLALEPVKCSRLRPNCPRKSLVIDAVSGDGAMNRALSLRVPAMHLMISGRRRLMSTVLKFTDRLSSRWLLILAS